MLEQQKIPPGLHTATCFYLLLSLPVLIMYNLCLCVYVFVLVCLFCLYSSHYCYNVFVPLHVHMSHHVLRLAFNRVFSLSNMQIAAAGIQSCVVGLFTPLCMRVHLLSGWSKDKTAFVISIAPTGSICFITTKAKSVLSGKSCRHPENKTPNKWAKQQSAAVSGE